MVGVVLLPWKLHNKFTEFNSFNTFLYLIKAGFLFNTVIWSPILIIPSSVHKIFWPNNILLFIIRYVANVFSGSFHVTPVFLVGSSNNTPGTKFYSKKIHVINNKMFHTIYFKWWPSGKNNIGPETIHWKWLFQTAIQAI